MTHRPKPTTPSRAHARGKRRLTAERKRLFLEHLALTGIVAEAARIASPHSTNGCLTSFKDERARDAEFAAAWDEALNHAVGILEREAFRRAVEGWDEPTRFGTVRKHSDRLLELMLKARIPQFREHRKYEVDAKTKVEPSIGVDKLSPKQRELLEQILTSPCHDLAPNSAGDLTHQDSAPSGDGSKATETDD